MEQGKIYEAISDVMSDIGAVGKNDVNKTQGFKYRGIDAVMNAINPAMTKHKVFCSPEVLEQRREERTSSKGGLLIYSICKIRFRFYTTDGSYVDAVTIGEGMDSGDKATNKAMAIAFKYACFQVFCIPTEEMNDPDSESPEAQPKGDKNMIPNESTKISAKQVLNLKDELDRTGVDASVICDMFHVNTFEDMTESQYVACMNKFKATPDKAV